MTQIGRDLMEAYIGLYSEDWLRDAVGEASHQYNLDGEVTEPIKKWQDIRARLAISAATPKERLAAYLEWNGIVGYTDRIFELANGET